MSMIKHLSNTIKRNFNTISFVTGMLFLFKELLIPSSAVNSQLGALLIIISVLNRTGSMLISYLDSRPLGGIVGNNNIINYGSAGQDPTAPVAKTIDHEYALVVATQTVVRIKKEIIAVTKRANIYLLAGALTTICALIVLGFFVVENGNSSKTVREFILEFLPKISLTLFVEVFAFFFLRLHRSSIQEIKYYQNELTNIENKHVALTVAIVDGEEADISEVIRNLIAVERNFKLLKGESTIELQKLRYETNSLRDSLKYTIGSWGRFGKKES